MSEILANQTAQDEIIDFMIKEAKKNKYIGWQFDFENINHLDRDMYSEFLKKTYKKMKENNLQCSVAVIVRADDYDPQSQNQDWSSAYDYKKLAENSDFLSLMSYDDPKSIGPVASLPYINRILDYKLKNISPEKLSLGIPLYCWQWQDGKRTNSTTYNLAEKAYKKVKDKNKKRTFDKVLGAEVFEFKRDDVNHKIWCDNQESFAIKFDLIEKKGLRGFSAWALGQEDKRLWSLLN
jgi:spore germination protein YaaH